MKYKFFFLLLITSAFMSCSYLLVKPVQQSFDEYKNENISTYELYQRAYSLWTKKRWHNTFLHFIQLEKEKETIHKLHIKINTDLNSQIENKLYFKIKDKIFNTSVDSILYIQKHKKESNTETEISKSPGKKSKKNTKEIIETTIKTSEFDYNETVIYCNLPEYLIKKIANTDTFSIRFYKNEEAFTLEFNKNTTSHIKQVYNANTSVYDLSLKQ